MSSSSSKTPEITPRQTMRGHTDWVNGSVYLPDGRHIVTCSWDGSLRLWNLESGTQIGEDWRDENNIGLRSMALSPNGKTIASGDDDGKVRLWNVETRKVIARWTGHTRVVRTLCWSADGERVASGSWDGTAKVWDVRRGKTVLSIKTGNEWVYAVVYSPDSSKLATGGDREYAVKIWDSNTGERLKTLKHDDVVCSLAWTSDQKKLISGSYGPIRIFDTATWQQIAILEGHTSSVEVISLSRNNRLLASSTSWDQTVRLWNLDTNLPVVPPLKHDQGFLSAALSADGKVLVTTCKNQNAYTWDINAILEEAGLEYLLAIATNLAPEDKPDQKASQDDSGIQHTPRSSLDDMSFLEADATQSPGQFGDIDKLPPAFFDAMEADVDSSPMGGAHPHSSANALIAHIFSLLRRFRANNGKTTEPPQSRKLSAFHPHTLLARLSSLIHHSPPENDAPDELQRHSMPLRLELHVLLVRLSSLLPRSRLGTDEEAEPHPTMPSSSHPDALNSRLSSLFRFQTHTNEKIELQQPSLSRPRVVEVAAVRDKQTLVVARGPKFAKAKRAYEQQTQSHSQTQASSSHAQSAGVLTSTTPPAPGTSTTTADAATPQSPPITWWAQIVLFLCCASPPHADGRYYS
ncbi:WD40-repeat-containing domain protein [Suillus americanus]|nr:WD40-repeat-containing domain protein [Suillus americanus]